METVNTNLILKRTFSKLGKFEKNSYLNTLKVDIQNYSPILNPKYLRDEQTKNMMFIYIKNFKIIGILIGSKEANKDLNLKYRCIQNRKSLLTECDTVLGIPKEDRNFKIKINSKYRKIGEDKNTIRNRLQKYKIEKNEKVTHDQIMAYTMDIINYFSVRMFSNQISENIKIKLSNLHFSSHGNSTSYLTTFLNVVEQYNTNYKNYIDNIKSENELSEDERSFNEYWYKDHYDQAKIRIIEWKKAIS